MNHNELKEKALSRSGVRKEYDSMDMEFALLRMMLKAREEEGLSQAQIAEKMGKPKQFAPASKLLASLQPRPFEDDAGSDFSN